MVVSCVVDGIPAYVVKNDHTGKFCTRLGYSCGSPIMVNP